MICGHESNRAQARWHLDQAERVGRRIGQDRNDFDTEYGSTNVLTEPRLSVHLS